MKNNWRFLVLVTLWAWAAGGQAAEVIFNTQRFTGVAQSRPIIIRQTDNLVISGTNLVYGPALTVLPTAGVARTNLLAGAYDLYLDPLPKSFVMVVPDGAGPYDAADLISGAVSSGASNRVFYSKSEVDALIAGLRAELPQFAAGSNIVFRVESGITNIDATGLSAPAETTTEVALLDGTGETILLDGSGETLVFDLN